MEIPLYFLLVVVFLLAARGITVLVHELGHAIPAILLSKESVSVYIGSLGDNTKSKNITIGLLDIWFTPNPIKWQTGLCVPSAASIAIHKQVVYVLAGPLASFGFAALACYLYFNYSVHGSLQTFFTAFLISCVFDLFTNLVPSPKPIRLPNGKVTYNDGQILKHLWIYHQFPKRFSKAAKLYNEENYEDAALGFHTLLKAGFKHQDVYRYAISAYLETNNHVMAKELSEEFISLNKMDSNDYGMAGLASSKCGEHERALEFYDHSLALDANNHSSLNNKGYTLNVLNRYEEAIPLFDKAIEIDKSSAFPYNNRGLAKIKLGKEEEGLAEIHRSFELDGANSYCYLNLGIYHLDKGENAKALELFTKAKAMDQTTVDIDKYITLARV